MTPCAGLHELFDSTEPSDHMQAKALCEACPVIDWCRTRVPAGHQFPEGTWAGVLYTGTGRTDVLACRECDEAFMAGRTAIGREAYCSVSCRSKARQRQRARYELEASGRRQRNRAAVARYKAKRKAMGRAS